MEKSVLPLLSFAEKSGFFFQIWSFTRFKKIVPNSHLPLPPWKSPFAKVNKILIHLIHTLCSTHFDLPTSMLFGCLILLLPPLLDKSASSVDTWASHLLHSTLQLMVKAQDCLVGSNTSSYRKQNHSASWQKWKMEITNNSFHIALHRYANTALCFHWVRN